MLTTGVFLHKHPKKWTMLIRNWDGILNQFLTIFENRIQL